MTARGFGSRCAPLDPAARAERLSAVGRHLRELDRGAFDPRTLQAAAAAWAARAQMEHASIAAFDRFSLGLLAVGAPAELLEASHRAALDEIAHARIGFAVASAYGGAPIGPGPLDIEGALDAIRTLPRLVESTIAEGCVGETISAIEAEEAAAIATEPAAREALIVIADDEARHAELAWAFVGWARARHPALASLVERTFAEALCAARATDPRAVEPSLEPFGFLSRSRATEVRGRALAEVIVPTAVALTRG